MEHCEVTFMTYSPFSLPLLFGQPALNSSFPLSLDFQKVQNHWLDGVSNLFNLELEAMTQYNHLWFALWADCVSADDNVCHERLIDHWSEHSKLMLDHQKRREAIINQWKDHIEEVL